MIDSLNNVQFLYCRLNKYINYLKYNIGPGQWMFLIKKHFNDIFRGYLSEGGLQSFYDEFRRRHLVFPDRSPLNLAADAITSIARHVSN